MEKKKIVVLDAFLKPIFGGGQIVTNLLFKYLSNDFDVKFVGDKTRSDPFYSVAIPGFRDSYLRRLILWIFSFRSVYRTVKGNELGMSNIQYRFVVSLPKFFVDKLVNKDAIKLMEGADVIISNSMYDPFLLRVAKIRGKKIIRVNHLPLNLESTRKIDLFLKYICDRNDAELISVVLSGSQAKASNDLGIKTVLIPNGIEQTNISDKVISDTLNKFGLAGKRFLFSIGRLQDSQKGFSLSIRAMSLLKDKDLVYVIAGSGPDRDYYTNLVSSLGLTDRVKLIGFVSDEEKLALMHSSFAFLQPSYFESFGIVTLEALSQGAIVLVSRNEGSVDMIKDGENGFFIELREEDIKNKIETVLGMTEKERGRIKTNAIQTAKVYSAENMISKYVDLIADQR